MIYCVGFACDLAQKNVALIRKKRPTWQEHRLNGIGGKIEFGETPLAGMIREFEEETGIHHEDWVDTVTLFGPVHTVISMI